MNNRIRKGSSSNIWKNKNNEILIPKEPFIFHPQQWYHCLLFIDPKVGNVDAYAMVGISVEGYAMVGISTASEYRR